jgi:hypothetical protein
MRFSHCNKSSSTSGGRSSSHSSNNPPPNKRIRRFRWSVYSKQFCAIALAFLFVCICGWLVFGRSHYGQHWQFGRLASVAHTIIMVRTGMNESEPVVHVAPPVPPVPPAPPASELGGSADPVAPVGTDDDPFLTTRQALDGHPLRQYHGKMLLEDVVVYLKQQPTCNDLPIFITMANVASELYWEL